MSTTLIGQRYGFALQHKSASRMVPQSLAPRARRPPTLHAFLRAVYPSLTLIASSTNGHPLSRQRPTTAAEQAVHCLEAWPTMQVCTEERAASKGCSDGTMQVCREKKAHEQAEGRYAGIRSEKRAAI